MKTKEETPQNLEIDNPELLKKNINPLNKGLIFLMISLGIFLIWALYAPLDEGVPCEGIVSLDTKRKTLQHQTGGIIKTVFVKEGQLVKAGQPLIELDDSTTKARLEETRQRFFVLRASEDRIQAERSGSSEITFHPDLIRFIDEQPIVKQHMLNQKKLMQLKKSTLSAQLESIAESIKGQEAQYDGLKKIITTNKSQIAILTKQLNSVSNLAAEGYAPLSQKQDLEMKLGSLTSQLDESESSVIKIEKSIQELKQKALSIRENARKDIEIEQSQVILELDASAQKLKALNEELERIIIRSPVDGQVIGLQFQTVGGVIGSGQRLLDIVPQGEPLMIEAKITPTLIDRIQLNQSADIRFTNFAGTPQIVVEGRLTSISNDLLSEAKSADITSSFYLARILVTDEGMKQLGRHHMQPGMPAQVIIKTGERSLFKYLIGPFAKRVSKAFTEE